MNSKQQDKFEEKGFVLITAIIILSIITFTGIATMFKSSIEVKVSASSVEQAKAFSAAKAGLAQNFNDWKGVNAAEKATIDTAMINGTPHVTGIYDDSMTPTSMSDLGANIASIDAYVTSHGNVKVYDVTMNGLTVGQWGAGSNPQVALWAASFTKQTEPKYPYLTANTTSCPDCNIITYALGRYGQSRSLQREVQGTNTFAPNGVSAITNSPNTAYWADLCNGSNGSTMQSRSNPFGVTGERSPATPVPTPTVIHDWMIEATQAQYSIFSNPTLPNENIPSGVAFASNTATGIGNSEFEAEFPITNSENTSTVAVYSTDPLIAYSGHATTNQIRADYASLARDTTSPAATDLPTGKLPYKLVNDKLLGSNGQLKLQDGQGNIFDLDALRWGAEQFTCRTPGVSSNAAPNGKFCSKAELLRAAVHAGRTVRNNGASVTSDPNSAPVTGRLTFSEFQYNVANAVPMFGLIRVMFPAIPDVGNNGMCNGVPTQLYKTEDESEELKWSLGANDYDGSPTVRDSDGKLGNKAKLIVYGSITIDFFADDNENGINEPTDGNFRFDPFSREHILTNLQNGESKAEMTVPELINPSLPYGASAPMASFPTAAGGKIAVGSSINPANLASPTSGWFPASEGLVPSNAGSAAQGDGRMELMNPVSGTNSMSKLLYLGEQLHTNATVSASSAGNFFTAYKTRLEYYYKMKLASANTSDSNNWPMAAFPSTISDDFCIGSQDCAPAPAGSGPNHDGDKVNLLFPSAYLHGWKVALAALDLTAEDWNGLLDGIDILSVGFASDFDTASNTKGSPFNPSIDGHGTFTTLADKAADLISKNTNDHLYFYTDKGPNSNYALLTFNWADIPVFNYSGGFMQIQHVSNISGAVYTPGPMSWGAEDNTTDPATGYFAGSIITGFGFSRGPEGGHPPSPGYAVVVFDPQVVDNSNINTLTPLLRRYAWQQLN